MTHLIRRVLIPCLVILVAGCSSPGDAPTRFYLIEPLTATGTGEGSNLAIAVDNLEIPQYLERFQIASRRNENQIAFAANHQWAENLRKNLSRTLASNLTNFLGTPDIGTPANRSNSKPDYRLNLSIERFERDANGFIQLVARWQIAKGDTRESVVTRSSQYQSEQRIASKDFAGSVQAMSRLFSRLSVDIGQTIVELP